MLAVSNRAVTYIIAGELVEGDIVRNFNGEIWAVGKAPKHTRKGVEIEVVVLGSKKTQKVCFHPSWRFELVDAGVQSFNRAVEIEVAA